MIVIKSYSVHKGDMFCIAHGNNTLTLIDCNLVDDVKDEIMADLKRLNLTTSAVRFISTHPDDDHIHGLEELERNKFTQNFYCVQNDIKGTGTRSFQCYKALRDGCGFYPLEKESKRAWLNKKSGDRKGSGIEVLWPDINNPAFKDALRTANNKGEVNNISPIIQYRRKHGACVVWMGDMEEDFMESIIDDVDLPKVDILFAPHHGRKSGRIPIEWLKTMDPEIIVIGEAESDHLHYYPGYKTITQNSAGTIVFKCQERWTDVFVDNESYKLPELKKRTGQSYGSMHYIGSLETLD